MEAALQAAPAITSSGTIAPDGGALWHPTDTLDSTREFCRSLLDLLAADLDGLVAAMIVLRAGAEDRFVPAAVWPATATDLSLLADGAERALRERRGIELLASDEAADARLRYTQIALPVEAGQQLVGAIAVGARTASPAERQHIRRRLYWASAWVVNLGLQERVRAAQARLEAVERVGRITGETLDAASFDEAAATLVAALTKDLGLRRATLGLAKHGRVVIVRSSIADAAAVLPDDALVRAAMQEAFDQELDLLHPPQAGGTQTQRAVSDDHARLVAAAPDTIVQTLLLKAQGHPRGVLLLEHAADAAPDGAHRLLAESLGHLLAPALTEKRERDRWFNGRLLRKLATARRTLLGPYRASWKLFAAAAVAVLLFLVLAEGRFRVTAKTVIEGEVLRAVVAPYDGYIRDALVRAGETVAAGQVLATLDDRDIKLEKVRWESEAEQSARKYRDALAKHDRATAAVYGAQLHEARAQLALAVEKLARTVIRAPFDGFVVTGDLNQLRGSAVEQGKILFEVTPLDAYRVVLKVDERDIGYLRVGQPGTLALSGLVGRPLPFQVNRVTPVATNEEGVNFFRVEAKLSEAHPGLRPGMEGIGKVTVGQDKYWWIWSRQLVDWVRLTLWSWWP